MIDMTDIKDRKVMFLGIVTVMVSKRPFRAFEGGAELLRRSQIPLPRSAHGHDVSLVSHRVYLPSQTRQREALVRFRVKEQLHS